MRVFFILKFGEMAERTNAPDCKSGSNDALVQIQLLPPNATCSNRQDNTEIEF